MLMVNGLTSSDIASRGFPVLDLYLAQLTQQGNKEVGSVPFAQEPETNCPVIFLSYGHLYPVFRIFIDLNTLRIQIRGQDSDSDS